MEQHLDDRLRIAEFDDRTGNGLLVRGRPVVSRIAGALNTSFAAIAAAAGAGAELLFVHHPPWAEIDLGLRAPKLARLESLGISLYAAHEALDRAPAASTALTLAPLLGLAPEAGGHEDLLVCAAPAMGFEDWVRNVASRLRAPVRAWRNSATFRRVGIVPGGGGSTHYLAAAAAAGCDTFLTGEGSLYTELFAREMGMSLVYATHAATEFPAVTAFVASVAAELKVDFVAIPEAEWITGGGRAPIEHGFGEHGI